MTKSSKAIIIRSGLSHIKEYSLRFATITEELALMLHEHKCAVSIARFVSNKRFEPVYLAF